MYILIIEDFVIVILLYMEFFFFHLLLIRFETIILSLANRKQEECSFSFRLKSNLFKKED
mgnify:FL=1